MVLFVGLTKLEQVFIVKKLENDCFDDVSRVESILVMDALGINEGKELVC